MGSRFGLLWVLPPWAHLGVNYCIVTPPEGSLGEEWVPLSGVGASYQFLGFCLGARSSCIQQLRIQKPTQKGQLQNALEQWLPKGGLRWKPPSHPPSTEMSTDRPPVSTRAGTGPQDPVRPTPPEGGAHKGVWWQRVDAAFPLGAEATVGDSEGVLRVSGGPLSSRTLGVCGAGTCVRRSGNMSDTGTS